RADPRPDVPGVHARPAAPRPPGDRGGDDRLLPLRRHAADGVPTRSRALVPGTHGRRTRRRGLGAAVPSARPPGPAHALQLGNRGRGRTGTPGPRTRQPRTTLATRRAGAVETRTRRRTARGGVAIPVTRLNTRHIGTTRSEAPPPGARIPSRIAILK